MPGDRYFISDPFAAYFLTMIVVAISLKWA